MVDNYRMMARYNHWMNEKLFAAAGSLSDQVRKRNMGAFFHSIHGTFNHILVGDTLWMNRFERKPIVWHGHAHQMYADFNQLEHARQAMDARIVAFTDALTAEWIATPFDYNKLSGNPVRVTGWAALTHFFNHQTHHRGQVTTLLKQCDVDPGDTDIVAMPDVQGVQE